MRIISRLRGRCYCAFCKAERTVYLKKHVDLTNVLGAVLLSIALAQAYWGTPDPRAVFIFCLVMLASETFIYLRWRASITCKLCGFDPILYKRSPSDAAARVRAFFEQQKVKPEFLLSRSPLLQTIRIKQQQQKRAAQYHRLEGKLLSPSPKNARERLAKSKSP